MSKKNKNSQPEMNELTHLLPQSNAVVGKPLSGLFS